jgi:hypothetical protein
MTTIVVIANDLRRPRMTVRKLQTSPRHLQQLSVTEVLPTQGR